MRDLIPSLTTYEAILLLNWQNDEVIGSTILS